HVAKGEITGGVQRWWPLAGLAAPVVLAGFVNPPGDWFEPTVAAPVLVYVLWTVRSVSQLFRRDPAGPVRTVSGLLAGIALVDLASLAPPLLPWGVVF